MTKYKTMKKILFLTLFLALSFFSQAQCDKDHVILPARLEPNNENDLPKTLLVETRGVKDLKLVIYDRRGNEIFKSDTDVLGADIGKTKEIDTEWNGTVLGEQLPAGIYVYTVEAQCVDKTIIRKSGTIVLTLEKQ